MRKRVLEGLKLVLVITVAVSAISLWASKAPFTPSEQLHTLTDSVSALQEHGRFSEAAVLAEEILSLLQSESRVQTYRVADAERLVNTLRLLSGRPDSSKAAFARSLRRKSEYDELFQFGDYAEAEKVIKEIIDTQTAILGPNHPQVAARMNDLARTRQKQADYGEAENIYDEALTIQERMLGKEHPDVATTLSNLGILYLDRGAFGDSEKLLRRALAMRRRLLGSVHPDIANNLNDLGHLLWKMGEYKEAELIMLDALAMQRAVHGNKHHAIATALNNLALPLVSLGRYDDAEPIYREALDIRREMLGESHPDVAKSLNNLAGMLWHKGEYAAAEPLLERALAIKRETQDSDHPTVGLSLSNLAAVRWKQGDFMAAELLLEDALTNFQNSLGRDHPNVGLVLNNLSMILQEQGNYARADTLQAEALRIYRKCLGNDHKDTATFMSNFAAVLAKRGEYARSEKHFHDALETYKQQLGENHPDIATCLNHLGAMMLLQGRLSDAEQALTKAANINRRLFAGTHPELVTILSRIGAVHLRNNEYREAIEALKEAGEVFEKSRRRVSAKTLVRAIYTAADSPYPLLAVAQVEAGDTNGAWQSAERDRGRTLLDILETKELRSLTPEEIEDEERLNRELTHMENTLVAIESATSTASAEKADSVRTLLHELASRWLTFENRLAEKYPIAEGQAYPREKIQSVLAAGDAVLGWLEVEDHHYVYLVPPEGPVVWRELTPVLTDSIAVLYRNEVGSFSESSDLWKDLGRLIYRERLAPLEPEFEELKHLYIIASGPMVGIPVEALMINKDLYVADKWEISYTPSATVLAWLKERPEPQSSTALLAVADPPFNKEQAMAMKNGGKTASYAQPGGRLERTTVYRKLANGSRNAMRELDRLDGSRWEVGEISQLFKHSLVLTGCDASEQNMTRLAHRDTLSSFRYVHLATHAIPDFRRGERSFLVLSQVDLPDPFETAVAGERMIDGRLEMEEVLREWRLDADLVTLSACETALGRKTRGEGYVGFAHAFFRAGARSVLVSLWKADDHATRRLMVRFYVNVIEGGMTKSKALQEAKHWLRDRTASGGRKPYSHPYFWAGFILSGDPK